MFERFTRDARAVVVATQDLCTSPGIEEVRPVHLLLALTEQGSGAREVLAEHGITEDAVRVALEAPRPTPAGPLGDGDAAALRALGIDLDAIRAAVERQFGAGALDGPAAEPGERGDEPGERDDESDRNPRRLGLGGHVRFGRGAKKVLELAVREAIRTRSGEIRCEHIALAVLRTDDEAVRLLLRTLGADPRAVRADLEGHGRRSA